MQKKSLVLLLTVLGFLFVVGNSHAAKPEGVGGQKEPEVRESFFQRWFGGAKKEEVKASKAVKEKKVKEEKQKKDKKEHRTFSNTERASIYDYYRRENSQHSGGKHKGKKDKKNKNKQLPPGLQKKLQRGGELPPGWQTKVNRGEVLDSEILRYAQPLPTDLSRRLPILRDGEEMLRIGDRVVRVLEGNGTVLDVIDLADIMLR